MAKSRLLVQYDKAQVLEQLRRAYDDDYFLKVSPSEFEGKDHAYMLLMVRSLAHSHNMTLLARRRLLEKLFDLTSRYEYLTKKFLYLESKRKGRLTFSDLHLVKNAEVREADKVLRIEMMKAIKEAK